MFEFISEIGEQFVTHIESQIENTEKPLEIDFSVMSPRVTTDLIAFTAFGIKVDSFKNPDNEFYTLGRLIFDFSLWRLVMYTLVPKLAIKLNVLAMPPAIYDFFNGTITSALKQRREQNIVRPDMIHLMMEAKKRADEEDSEIGKKKKNQGYTHLSEKL